MADEFEKQILNYQQKQQDLERMQQHQHEIAAQKLLDQKLRQEQEKKLQYQQNEALLTTFHAEAQEMAEKLQFRQLLEKIRSHLWNGVGEIVERTKGWPHEGSEGATAEYELALIYPFFEKMGEGWESTGDVDTAGNGISIRYEYPIVRQHGISLHITRSQIDDPEYSLTHSLILSYTPDPFNAPFTSNTQNPLEIFENSLYADVFGYNLSKKDYFDYRKTDDIVNFRTKLIEVGASLSPQRLGLPEQFSPQSPQSREKRGWLRRLFE